MYSTVHDPPSPVDPDSTKEKVRREERMKKIRNSVVDLVIMAKSIHNARLIKHNSWFVEFYEMILFCVHDETQIVGPKKAKTGRVRNASENYDGTMTSV